MAAQRDLKVSHPEIDETGAAEPAPGTPIDAKALRKALGEERAATARSREPASHVRSLRDRAEAALSGNQAEVALNAEATWSLRRQFLFIAFASALCWAVVLAPLVLVF